jgi:hypothetical protein
MVLKTVNAAVLCAAVLLGGCASVEDALFPADDSSDSQAVVVNAPASSGGGSPVSVTQSALMDRPGVPTGTFVGQKVNNLRNDLRQLQTTLNQQNQSLQSIRNQTVQDSQQFHGTVAAINARLQVGTTPGNPILSQQWNGAQGELDRINDDVLKLTRLSNEVTTSSGLAAYMLESVRAARQLSGAVDEDHRQLAVLEDDTNRTAVLIERLLSEMSNDINRQQHYIAAERQNLNTMALAIKNGQLYGSALSSSPAGYAPVTFSGRGADITTESPLVTIRFDKPNVNYEGALYAAVKSAIDRRPDAVFDVVSVSSTGATPGQDALNASSSRRNAEQVVRSLNNFGLPADRVRLSSSSKSSGRVGEVLIFVR